MAGSLGRAALLIATYQYEDPGLRALKAPEADAKALAQVLADAEIADFEVTTLVNQPLDVVGRAIGEFFQNRRRQDVTLLYVTGHGLRDDDGRFYFAMKDTRRSNLLFTSLAAEQIDAAMEASASQQKILILDCSYIGLFPAGRTARADPAAHSLDKLRGRGRVVLTASDATEYAFEGDSIQGEGLGSAFTKYLVEGMRTGRADLDGDGEISLAELYSYAHDRVIEETPQQRPKKNEDVEGSIAIGRNINWTLPTYLTHAIGSPIARDRLGAIEGLAQLYRVGNPLVKSRVLEQMTLLGDDDSRSVSTAAQRWLRQQNAAEPVEERPVPAQGSDPDRVRTPAAELDRIPVAVVDENVQFTVYRPNAVIPEVWYPLLAFAHLAERRADAPPTQPDPLEQVRALAVQALGEKAAYGAPRVDARGGVPREGQLTFAPFVEGVDFNPRTQTFEWQEDVHQQSFRLKAGSYAAGSVLRGQLTVYLGAVILADIDLSFRVDIAAPPPPTPSVRIVSLLANGSPPASPQPELTPATANPYNKIFVSYSHKDRDIVHQFEAYGKTLGNDYLRDQLTLRAGDEWDVRLLQLIDEANIFQLFWSSNSMRSKYVRREWEHALALGRPAFIRPTYWEVPMPHSDNPRLPPDELAKLHFHGFFEEMDGGLDGVWPPPQSPPLGSSRSVRPAAASVAASDSARQAASGSNMRRPWLIGCAVIIVVVLIALLVVFLVRG